MCNAMECQWIRKYWSVSVLAVVAMLVLTVEVWFIPVAAVVPPHPYPQIPKGMTVEQAKAYALGQIKTPPPPSEIMERPAGHFEGEVVGLAELVAKGETPASLLQQFYEQFVPEDREAVRKLNEEESRTNFLTSAISELQRQNKEAINEAYEAARLHQPERQAAANRKLAEQLDQLERLAHQMIVSNIEEDRRMPGVMNAIRRGKQDAEKEKEKEKKLR